MAPPYTRAYASPFARAAHSFDMTSFQAKNGAI